MSALRFWMLFILFLGTYALPVQGQLSYQVSNYTARETGAGNQNWDITTAGNESVYIANNNGLLIFENSAFSLHTLPGSTVFRSVALIDSTIYTGSFENFGYWKKGENDELQYHSLVNMLDNPDLNNDEIWQIVKHQDKIYFHSFGSVYCYDPANEQVYRINTSGSMMLLHKTGGMVYTQRVQKQLYRLENDEFLPIPGSQFLQDEEVHKLTIWI